MRCCHLVYVILILVAAGWSETVFAASSERDIVASVWATLGENRTATLHYSVRGHGKWGPVEQVALNRGLHVTPAIAVDTDKTIWLVWIEQTSEENILRYGVIRNGKLQTGRVGTSGNEQSFAPTILLDAKGNPWIAWSGMTGMLSDIYISRWNGTGWEERVMVHTKNDSPDITPFLGMNKDKNLWISWFGFTTAHQYVRYTADQREGKWHVASSTATKKETDAFIKQRINTGIILPVQAKNRLMGAIFTGTSNEIQSISERFISFTTAGVNNG